MDPNSSEQIATFTIDQILDNRWKIIEKLGSGGYGSVYKAEDIIGKGSVAIKLEKKIKNRSKCRLTREVHVYKCIKDTRHFPKLYADIEADNHHFLVLQLLGPSMDRLLQQCGKFSPATLSHVGCQCLEAIQHLHTKNILHCDIKTSNFAIGLGKHSRTVYLFDFGLSKTYDSNEDKTTVLRKGVTGTTLYASVNVQMGRPLTRDDDLKSFFYTLYEMAVGRLPWESESDTGKVLELKLKHSIVEMNAAMPDQLKPIGDYLNELSPDDVPNYPAMLDVFLQAVNGTSLGNTIYDWEQPDTGEKPTKSSAK